MIKLMTGVDNRSQIKSYMYVYVFLIKLQTKVTYLVSLYATHLCLISGVCTHVREMVAKYVLSLVKSQTVTVLQNYDMVI